MVATIVLIAGGILAIVLFVVAEEKHRSASPSVSSSGSNESLRDPDEFEDIANKPSLGSLASSAKSTVTESRVWNGGGKAIKGTHNRTTGKLWNGVMKGLGKVSEEFFDFIEESKEADKNLEEIHKELRNETGNLDNLREKWRQLNADIMKSLSQSNIAIEKDKQREFKSLKQRFKELKEESDPEERREKWEKFNRDLMKFLSQSNVAVEREKLREAEELEREFAEVEEQVEETREEIKEEESLLKRLKGLLRSITSDEEEIEEREDELEHEFEELEEHEKEELKREFKEKIPEGAEKGATASSIKPHIDELQEQFEEELKEEESEEAKLKKATKKLQEKTRKFRNWIDNMSESLKEHELWARSIEETAEENRKEIEQFINQDQENERVEKKEKRLINGLLRNAGVKPDKVPNKDKKKWEDQLVSGSDEWERILGDVKDAFGANMYSLRNRFDPFELSYRIVQEKGDNETTDFNVLQHYESLNASGLSEQDVRKLIDEEMRFHTAKHLLENKYDREFSEEEIAEIGIDAILFALQESGLPKDFLMDLYSGLH